MEPNISKELINELHRLTGAGMMRCKTSLVALIDALKKIPNKTDAGYEIKIDFEEYPLRKMPQERTVMLFKFTGICSDDNLNDDRIVFRKDCTNFSHEVYSNELPESLILAWNEYEKENSKVLSERHEDLLESLKIRMYSEFDEFLKKELDKKFVHTEYFTVTF